MGLLILAAIIWYAIVAMSAKPLATATTDNGALVASTNNSAMATDANATDADVNAMDADANAVAPIAGADTNSVDTSLSNTGENNSAVPTGSQAPITDILSVVDAQKPAELYGKSVKLLGAPVQAAGTTVFWIGPSFEQKMLVVTDGSTNMNGINTDVTTRDRVNIEGTLMEINDFNDAKSKYNLDDNAITYLTNKKMFLMASDVSRDKK